MLHIIADALLLATFRSLPPRPSQPQNGPRVTGRPAEWAPNFQLRV
jgi:hypothetical protein